MDLNTKNIETYKGKDSVKHYTTTEIKPIEKRLIDKYFKEHQVDFKQFHIEFDSFYTTNSKENKYFSDLFFERLKKKNLIFSFCFRIYNIFFFKMI